MQIKYLTKEESLNTTSPHPTAFKYVEMLKRLNKICTIFVIKLQ